MNSHEIDLGHCRPFTVCARLRTVESRNAQGPRSSHGYLCASKASFELKKLFTLPGETRKARKDAIPHERGLNASAPSRIFSTALADPKGRFCRLRPTWSTPPSMDSA